MAKFRFTVDVRHSTLQDVEADSLAEAEEKLRLGDYKLLDKHRMPDTRRDVEDERGRILKKYWGRASPLQDEVIIMLVSCQRIMYQMVMVASCKEFCDSTNNLLHQLTAMQARLSPLVEPTRDDLIDIVQGFAAVIEAFDKEPDQLNLDNALELLRKWRFPVRRVMRMLADREVGEQRSSSSRCKAPLEPASPPEPART